MKGRVRAFLGATAPRRTPAEIAESDRLRAAVQRHDVPVADLARAAGCTRGTVRAWLDRGHHLAPTLQAGIRRAYSAETGGPG